MNKVEVKIEGLSYSKSESGSCVIILSELNKGKKLPIVINPNDGQFIAIKFNKINVNSTSTQDIVKLITDAYQIDIQEVVVYSLMDGIFYAKLLSSNSIETYEIECGISTALSMAAVYECPIYVSDDIINEAGFEIDEEGNPVDVKPKKAPPLKPKNTSSKLPKLKNKPLSLENLGKLLQEAVDKEDFEQAVILRDKIESLKK